MENFLLPLFIAGFSALIVTVLWGTGALVVRANQFARNGQWGWVLVHWLIIILAVAFIAWYIATMKPDTHGLS